MSEADRVRWDERYTGDGPADREAGPPTAFAQHTEVFGTSGTALELACGAGQASVWLALRGLRVHGVDVSPVAVAQARTLARRCGVARRCRFSVADLDDGLPAGLPTGPPVDVILCHRFRDARLDRAIIERLAPGGLLAIAALSEVGARPGPFRVAAGELPAAFAGLTVVDAGEGDGLAWLLARKAGSPAAVGVVAPTPAPAP